MDPIRNFIEVTVQEQQGLSDRLQKSHMLQHGASQPLGDVQSVMSHAEDEAC